MKKLLTVNELSRPELWTTPIDGGEKRKLCFAPEINRDTDYKHVEKLKDELGKGWKKEHSALIFPAEDVEREVGRKIKLLDIKGLELEEKSLKEYYLVIDGQHRSWCWADMMTTLEPEDVILEIPSMNITLLPGETLFGYLSGINTSKKNWDLKQLTKGGSNTHPESEILKIYTERFKSNNLRGVALEGKFSMTSLNLFFFGNPTFINSSYMDKINRNIIDPPTKKDGLKLEKGKRIISIIEVKFKGHYYGGKELAFGINDFFNEIGEDEKAFEILESLEQSDVNSMFGTKKTTSREAVFEKLKEVALRVFPEIKFES